MKQKTVKIQHNKQFDTYGWVPLKKGDNYIGNTCIFAVAKGHDISPSGIRQGLLELVVNAPFLSFETADRYQKAIQNMDFGGATAADVIHIKYLAAILNLKVKVI